MVWWLRLVVAGSLTSFVAFGAACSGSDRPPFDAGVSSGARGGKSPVGEPEAGSSNGGEAPNAGGDGASGEGSSGGSSPGGSLRFGFDPAVGYIYGSLEEGADDYALSTVLDPNLYATQLPAAAAVMRIFRRSLYYLDLDLGLHVFKPDYVGSKAWDFNYDAPPDAAANDPIVPTPACGDDAPVDFLVSPDGAHLVYLCKDEKWYEDDAFVYGGPEKLLALGHDGLFLIGSPLSLGTMSIWDAQRHTQEAHHAQAMAWRAVENGFRYVTVRDGEEPNTLWELDAEANATALGVYPPLPEDISVDTDLVECLLLPDGALLQLAQTADRKYDVIVRRDLDAEAGEVVYTEESDPRVKMHLSTLFTGP